MLVQLGLTAQPPGFRGSWRCALARQLAQAERRSTGRPLRAVAALMGRHTTSYDSGGPPPYRIGNVHQPRRSRADRTLALMSSGSEGEDSTDPRRSTYGHSYWLRRCEGFLVETATRRIGRVAGIRYGEQSNEPALLEVRAGLFGRKTLLIRVEDVSEIAPDRSRIFMRPDRGTGLARES
jgi:hypothetical protein